jgi:hypothetical protein
MFLSQYELVATAIHKQSLRSQIWVYIRMFFNTGTLVGQKK